MAGEDSDSGNGTSYGILLCNTNRSTYYMTLENNTPLYTTNEQEAASLTVKPYKEDQFIIQFTESQRYLSSEEGKNVEKLITSEKPALWNITNFSKSKASDPFVMLYISRNTKSGVKYLGIHCLKKSKTLVLSQLAVPLYFKFPKLDSDSEAEGI